MPPLSMDVFFVFFGDILEMPGEYLLVMGESANSNPLWKQTAGKFWLYSGLGGMPGAIGIRRAQQNSVLRLLLKGTPNG